MGGREQNSARSGKLAVGSQEVQVAKTSAHAEAVRPQGYRAMAMVRARQ